MITRLVMLTVLGLAACAEAPDIGREASGAAAVPGTGLRDQDVNRAAQAMRDPATRAAFLARCEASQSRQDAATLAEMGRYMGVGPGAAPRAFCARMTQAVIDGRLTAADLESPRGGALSPRVVSVLQRRP